MNQERMNREAAAEYERLKEPLPQTIYDEIMAYPESEIHAAPRAFAGVSGHALAARISNLSGFAGGLLLRALKIGRGIAPDAFWKPTDPIPFTLTDPPPNRGILPGRRP